MKTKIVVFLSTLIVISLFAFNVEAQQAKPLVPNDLCIVDGNKYLAGEYYYLNGEKVKCGEDKEESTSLLPVHPQEIFDMFGPDRSDSANFVGLKVSSTIYFISGFAILLGLLAFIGLLLFKIISRNKSKILTVSIVISVLLVFCGFVMIIIMFVFFTSDKSHGPITQTCLSAPGSYGCAACKFDADFEDTSNACGFCENYYRQYAIDGVRPSQEWLTSKGVFENPCIEALIGGKPLPTNLEDTLNW